MLTMRHEEEALRDTPEEVKEVMVLNRIRWMLKGWVTARACESALPCAAARSSDYSQQLIEHMRSQGEHEASPEEIGSVLQFVNCLSSEDARCEQCLRRRASLEATDDVADLSEHEGSWGDGESI